MNLSKVVCMGMILLTAFFPAPVAFSETAPPSLAGLQVTPVISPAQTTNPGPSGTTSNTTTEFLQVSPVSESTPVVVPLSVVVVPVIQPTELPGQPVLSAFASATPKATVKLQQDSSTHFIMSYNVTNANSFGGAVLKWSPAADLTGLDRLSFEMRTNNLCATTQCLKIEIVDGTTRCGGANCKAVIPIFGLNANYQIRDIPISLIQAANPKINLTKLKQINFVIDNKMAKPDIGFVEIKTGGVYFTPTVLPAPAPLPVTDFSALVPAVVAMKPAGHNTVIGFVQDSSDHFKFSYNLALGADADFSRWGGVLMSFLPGAAFNIENEDLVFSIKSTQTTQMKLVLSSGFGADEKKITLILKNLKTGYQSFRITKEMLALAGVRGFEPSEISFISFVVDHPTALSKTAKGTVEVITKGLSIIPVVKPV